MANDQLTLRLSPDAREALDAAHKAVGAAVPLHRLAVLALARGAAQIAATPALIFTAAPVEKPDASQPKPKPSTASKPATARAASKPSKTEAEAARSRWGDVSEADFATLARDLEALRDVGSLGAVLKVSKAPTGNVYAWLKARRDGEAGSMSAETFRKLRTAVDKHNSKG